MTIEWPRRLAEEQAGWAATQTEALGVLRRIAARPGPSVAGAAFELLGPDVPLVDAAFRSTLRAVERFEAAEHRRLAPVLRVLVVEHEDQLERMYAALRTGRTAASADVVAAADRGLHGLSCSPADRCAAAAAAVEAHEVELQLKQAALAQIDEGALEGVVQTLLVAWGAQPGLGAAHAVEAALDAQRGLERALAGLGRVRK